MREVKIDSMDCHADKSARNDRKRGFFKQDSRILLGFVDFHRLQRILGFAMRKQGCADFCAEIRLESIAQTKGKLPALSRKAESTSEKLTKREINA